MALSGRPLLIALMAVGIMLTAKLHLIQVSNLILSLKLVFSSKANADDASKQVISQVLQPYVQLLPVPSEPVTL